jgi:urease accessory protein
MNTKLLSLFQFCDSNFPNGAFSQSFGLETYIQDDVVHDSTTFAKWLDVYLSEQLFHTDGLAVKMVFEALQDDDVRKIWETDRMLTVQNFAQESRKGSRRMGDRLLATATSLYQAPILNQYQERLENKESFGHPAVVFTMVGHHLNVSKDKTILYYLYVTIVDLVQNAVRAIPIGQTAGQKIIQQFQEKLTAVTKDVLELKEAEFGIVAPGLELSQMKHERVPVRIFSS